MSQKATKGTFSMSSHSLQESPKILDGKTIAETRSQKIATQIKENLKSGQRAPGLGVILIGEDPASQIYVKNKLLGCKKVGIESKTYILPETTHEIELLELIDKLNQNNTIDGILVQLPLPLHIDASKIVEKILPEKDVDGFHPYNIGRLCQNRTLLRPCTPYGIMELLKHTKIDLKGLNATVVGISNIVGRPMILELLNAGCTIEACHHLTKDLEEHVRRADLLVVAVGKPLLIKGDWIKKGAIVIDVGMNRAQDGSFIGDVEFDVAKERAAWITPVPGGVGPMTVAMLLQNTLMAYNMLEAIDFR